MLVGLNIFMYEINGSNQSGGLMTMVAIIITRE